MADYLWSGFPSMMHYLSHFSKVSISSIPELAYEFTLSEEEVLAALLYYREHQAEIDTQDEEEQALFDEMVKRYGENSSP